MYEYNPSTRKVQIKLQERIEFIKDTRDNLLPNDRTDFSQPIDIMTLLNVIYAIYAQTPSCNLCEAPRITGGGTLTARL